MSAKPAFVIVPGAWHVPAHYQKLHDGLKAAGYEGVSLDLPSCGPPEPLPDMSADIAVVAEAIQTYIDRGQDVVVIMHSLGGAVGSSACKGLLPQDQANGKGVIALVYLTAFAMEAGKSLVESQGGKHAPWVQLTEDHGKGNFMQPNKAPYDPRDTFYNDCTPGEAQAAWDMARLNHSNQVGNTVIPFAAWKEIESNYLICELDKAIPAEGQEFMASQAGGKWKRVERLDCGHSPFLSRPDETLAFVRRCAGEEL